MKKILITGGGGSMGTALVDGLRESGLYDVVGTARRPKEERGEVLLDVRDLERCIEVLKGVDMVVHLAFWMRNTDFVEQGIPTNIEGTYNIYEAARINGVKRVIFGSSNHVFGFYPMDADVGDYDEYRPDSYYGLCKCAAELIGRYYSDRFGISSFNIRIGHFRRTIIPEETVDAKRFAPGVRELNQLLTSRDAVQLIKCCIEADPAIMYKCFPGTSGNSGNFWDTSRLKDELGYEPEDDGSSFITPETNRNVTQYKGGAFPFM